MYLLAEIPFTSVELRWTSPLSGADYLRARQLRGAIANAFPDDSRFHQRGADGNPLYKYPHIQYRWKEGYGVVAGWHSGAETMLNISWLDLPLTIGKDEVCVSDAIISSQDAHFGMSESLRRYVFSSPVLLFKQKNYKKYKQLESEAARKVERDRLLMAQLLTAMRGVGVHFDVQLYAAFTEVTICRCYYKSQNMMGIQGSFATNAVLPNGFAVGHAVSHGYGWIVQS
jgi:hypothetical protein